jgi:hypothetical protein
LVQPPNDLIRGELRDAIAKDTKVMGLVFPLLDRGLTDPEIARQLGRDTPGFVSNNRTHIRALLDAHLPNGPTMAGQTAGAVRRIASAPGLSTEATAYLSKLLDALLAVSGEAAARGPVRDAKGSRTLSVEAGDLRSAVNDALRSRAELLVTRVRDETGVDADDYYNIVTIDFALDEVVRLVSMQSTSRSTKAMHEIGRLDLSIEQAVVDWALDLPITADLVSSARGRLAYWRSQ